MIDREEAEELRQEVMKALGMEPDARPKADEFRQIIQEAADKHKDIQEAKEMEKMQEEERVAAEYEAFVLEHFSERELRLIENCRNYADNDPAGLPGHNLMIIVAKLADMVGIVSEEGVLRGG